MDTVVAGVAVVGRAIIGANRWLSFVESERGRLDIVAASFEAYSMRFVASSGEYMDVEARTIRNFRKDSREGY